MPIQLDYTDKDFDSIEKRTRVLVQSRFPEWGDFDVANYENTLRELVSHVADVILAYVDKHARESRWGHATQRRSLLAHGKLFNYAPPGAVAARAVLRFSVRVALPNDVFIPAETPVRTPSVGNPIRYRTLEPALLVAGSLSVDVLAEASEARLDVFQSNVLPDQEVQLSASPFLQGTEVVTCGDGAYGRVDDFLESTESSRHYVVVVDAQDRATVRFGDGVNGAIPSGSIDVAYRTGGGGQGTVDQNALTVVDAGVVDVTGTTVTLEVVNPERSSPGVDRPTVPKLRDSMPRALRVMKRAVSREDFEDAALQVPGVLRALMLSNNEDAAVQENQGDLVILPVGGGLAPQALRDLVKATILAKTPPTITFRLRVLSAIIVPVNISTTVFFERDARPERVAEIRAAVAAALGAYFEPDPHVNPERAIKVNFGYRMRELDDANTDGKLPFSDIWTTIATTPGIRKLDDDDGLYLNGVRADLAVPMRGFPVLGGVTVVNGATGSPV